MNRGRIRPADHREIRELIPWHVNGTIGTLDRQKLDAHFLTCNACRNEMLQERRICEAMPPDSSVEYMPIASFRRLQSRLDDGEVERGRARAAHPPRPDARARAHAEARARGAARPLPWPRLAAASIVISALALSLIPTNMRYRMQAPVLSPDYHTVTTPGPRSGNEVIRAVFSPAIKLMELQLILDESDLQIVSGPTEAGVYSLAATSKRPVNSSLTLLRRHPAVRFAETIQPAKPRGNADFP
jgi:hypothetical protein